MNKLMKAAAVAVAGAAVMIGGTAVGGTVAHAEDTPAVGSFCTVINTAADAGEGDGTSGLITGNQGTVECEQDFDGGVVTSDSGAGV
ncbi:hypothetical protein [Streptomyces sp. NPDC012510]|uniref:hypothetical protein n=1 Tax=Streptomyces sp. NPDC012510 TaxID=3364838 RepID=UPI0036EFD4A7